jgi:cellulose synthase/poly-beta-1,6-N-acetylglucosamine synthase-like glycosyltransferase
VNDSLSIIVPVRNAEAHLHRQVHHLLELLPDLTSDFEIVIIDDGSIDHTADTARELARQYPQLRLICHGESRGREIAVKTGLASAQGQTVLVQEDFADVSPTHLRRLWSLRDDPHVVMARSQRRAGIFDSALLERLTTWGQALRNLARRATPGGIQMIRRDGAQALAGANAVIQVVANTAECTTGPTDRL